jgi:hypothetical protein
VASQVRCIGVALLLTLFAIAFFYFSTDISNLKS